MKHYDVITIGGGPAGITVAKNLGQHKRVAVIRPEKYSMVYCAMPYVIEDVIPIEKSFKKDALVTDAGADLIRGTVTRVDFESKSLTLEDGRRMTWEDLIIATGAEPILPPIEGVEKQGVCVFKTEEHLRVIKEMVEEHDIRTSVVVGAGAIGIEVAQALAKVTEQCHLVDMEEHILPNLADPEMVAPLEEVLAESGVILHMGSKVVRLDGESWVNAVHLDDGTTIAFGGSDDAPGGIIVFSVGMRAKTELFTDTPLAIGPQGIIVNDRMETNIPHVYAVGDCVQYISGITGEVVAGKLATNAVPMARMLCKNLLGEDRRYPGFFNGAATKVGSFFIGGTGLKEREAARWTEVICDHAELTTIFPILPGAKPVRLKLVAQRQGGRILGGQILSGEPVIDKLNIITLAIQKKMSLLDLAQLSYAAQPYQSFFPANNVIVACAEKILDRLRTGG